MAGTTQSAAGISGSSAGQSGGGGASSTGGTNQAGTNVGGASERAWWNESYPKRVRIEVDNTSGLAPLVDIPILIPLDAARFPYGDASADGHDLRFVSASNELLSHEVEQWAPGGMSSAWVKLPKLEASQKTDLFLYFGNPQAEILPPSAAQSVWSNSFAGVWHLSDAKDATGRHDSADSKTAFMPGVIGKGASFDGATQYMALPGGNYVSGLGAVTFSGWVRHQGTQSDGKGVILAIGTEAKTGHVSWTSVTYTGDGGVVGEANPDESTRAEAPSGPGNYPNDSWNYFTVVIDIAGKKITHYKNGTAIGSAYQGTWPMSAFKDSPSDRASIGTEEDRSLHFLSGMLDELRLETVARSPAWIAAQAHAQKADWLTFAAQEAR